MSPRKKKNVLYDRKGFSLIELIITVAFMAIVSIPIYSYFTDAMKHNKQTELRQDANVAAQNVLEDLKSAPYSLASSAGMENADPDVAGNDSTKWNFPTVTSPPAIGQPFTLQKNVYVNGSTFTVKAEVTPKQSFTNGAGSNIIYKKNKIPSMNEKTDLIAAETNVHKTEACLFYYNKCKERTGPLASIAGYATYLKRNLRIKIATSSASSDKVMVSVIGEYTFSKEAYGGSYPAGISENPYYNTVIKQKEYKIDKLKNIYLFYQPDPMVERPQSDTVIIDNNVMVGKFRSKQIGLYLMAQNTISAGETKPLGSTKRQRNSGYSLNLQGNGETGILFSVIDGIYTNLSSMYDTLNTTAIGGLDACVKRNGTEFEVIEQEDASRVAEIKVSVYKAYSTEEKDRYTTVEGVKVQQK